jgi:hypothetical protein
MRSDLLNDTRNVMSDDGGKRHVVGVIAAADLVVERIYGGCVDTHPHLPRSDRRRGNVAQFKRVGSAETAKHDSFHVIGHCECPFLSIPTFEIKFSCLGRRTRDSMCKPGKPVRCPAGRSAR